MGIVRKIRENARVEPPPMHRAGRGVSGGVTASDSVAQRWRHFQLSAGPVRLNEHGDYVFD
jgi:hypothetical protein